VLGLDGIGSAERFADYSQWEAWQRAQMSRSAAKPVNGNRRSRPASGETQPSATKKKLSYSEAREFDSIESRIAEAEQELHARRAALQDPAITSDRMRLESACIALEETQKAVDALYARWAELDEKLK
jgi:ATP-binding cassette subfamily F protein uup